MADNQMHADPATMRKFAESLAGTLTFYQKALEILDSNLGRLKATWRDQEFDIFEREVRTTRIIIEEFIKAGNDARATLLEDAERAEAVQRIHHQNH